MQLPKQFLILLSDIKRRQSLRGLSPEWFDTRLSGFTKSRFYIKKHLKCLYQKEGESLVGTFLAGRLVSVVATVDTEELTLASDLTGIFQELSVRLGRPAGKALGIQETSVFYWKVTGGRVSMGAYADPKGCLKIKIGVEKLEF